MKFLSRGLVAIAFVGLLVIFALNSHVAAQALDFGNHCPVFAYDGSRPEWDKPFETTGEAARKVWFQNSKNVQVEDWCQTKGQGLIPPEFVQSLWIYHMLSAPKEGDVVTYEAIVDFSSGVGQITQKTLLNPPLKMPKLSGALMLLKVDFSGTVAYTAILPADGKKEAYFQMPDGLIALLVQ